MPHQHPSEQIMVVLQGQIKVTSGGQEVILGSGEGFVVPGGEIHQVTALDQEVVVFSCKNLVDGKGRRAHADSLSSGSRILKRQ